ncbi:MAG: TIGR01620 family protein [Hyphomicrobium sp.]|nr:MAG: TIGR01620 family protein [Hyphomicrobium sp.]
MTDPKQAPSPPPRAPRVFKLDDPALASSNEDLFEPSGDTTSVRNAAQPRSLTTADLKRGVRWGAVVVSASMALAALALGLWFTRFVSIALERQDWIGWVAAALLGIIGFALFVVLARELIGFRRLARMSHLRKSISAALSAKDLKAERKAVAALTAHYRGRPDMKWGLARLADHAGDVLEPGQLLRLADRDVLVPLDQEARRIILASGKRVATVTALSPILWLGMIYVLVENVRMFRNLAGLYGGRPGVMGGLRLARLVVGHIIATGGVAMTDDLLGQFVGQDMLRRVSRRLGEGAFNGALTARLGVAAVEVMRPLPFLDAEPLRVREIFAELFRSMRGAATEPTRNPRDTRDDPTKDASR